MPPVNETWKAVGNRVREARIGGGYKNTRAVADLVTLPRFGKDTISAIERGERELFPHEAEELARVLHRPVEFFHEGQAEQDPLEAVITELASISERLAAMETGRADAFRILSTRVRSIERQIATMLEERTSLRVEIKRQNELLARQSRLLKNIEKLVEAPRDADVVTGRGAGPAWEHPPLTEGLPSLQGDEPDSSKTDDQDDQDLTSRRRLP